MLSKVQKARTPFPPIGKAYSQPHLAKVVPTVHGDSVGHYEGDTLVIDTVGVKVGRYAMVDRFGAPCTEALHVVERHRMLDYEAAKEAQERAQKEWPLVGVSLTDMIACE